MKRILIIAALTLTLLIGGHARPVHAAILPNCDKTVYYVEDESKNVTCSTTSTAGCIDGIGISPERYEELANRNSDPQAWKKAHAPIISTNTACGFNDFIQLFINLATYGLGLLAVVGVAVTIWGGFGFLLAMGSPEKIKEAKQTIWGAILGTFIVLIAFVMVNWVVGLLTGTGPVLFAGTEHAENFYGEKCPTYKACDKNNLHYNSAKDACRDSVESDKIQNGNAVTKAQTFLARLGCYNDAVDGCYGPNTKQAVTNFQTRNATFFTPNTAGAISSVDEWYALEDAVAGNGGYLGCGLGAPLTQTVTISYGSLGGNPLLGLSNNSATVTQKGTVTWTNSIETGSEPVIIQFKTSIADGTTDRPQFSIAKTQSKSLTFAKTGTFEYTATFQFGSPTDMVTQDGQINVVAE